MTSTFPADRPLATTDVFLAMMRRDLRVARRELPSFLLRTAMQPLMLMFVFGYLLPKTGTLPPRYGATLLPGVVALAITLSAVQSIALPMVAQFGFSKEIEDRLLAPIPTHLVAIEMITTATIQGVLAGLFVLPCGRLIMGEIPGLTFAHAIAALAMMTLGAATFSTLGLFIGCKVRPDQVGLMFSTVIGPMIFFGCTYYPWGDLYPLPVIQYAVLVNPLVYLSEGMRGTLTPTAPHMNLLEVTLALLTLLLILWYFGWRAFKKRAIG